MDTQEIYNVAKGGYTSWPLITVIFVILMIVAYTLWAFGELKPLKNKLVFALAFTTIGSALLAYTVHTWTSYTTLRDALTQGRCQVVEGVITQFKPIGKDRHGTESFVVSGRKFEYGHNKAGYNKTTFDGGVLGEGLPVRIWSYNGLLAKIEVLP